MMLITYSGHGGQVPDANAMPGDDGQDETWVLFDKMLLDDQLNVLWSQFKAGVNIFVLSDSCHSGTILRTRTTPPVREKAIPKDKQTEHIAANKDYYKSSQYLTGDERTIVVNATVLLISGCQDNQTSADGDHNGLFTEKLLVVWNNGSFSGSYKQFYQRILDKMPSTQTPNYFKVGVNNPDFEAQRPFTVGGSSASAGNTSSTPTVAGPSTLDRTMDDAPVFNVNTAGAPYYIFEITSDSSLFANRDGRDSNNFYGSYDDSGVPSRLTTATFTLPEAAWQTLKAADNLYYRIGTTTSLTGWDNYTNSTTDDQADNAPSISIDGAKALPAIVAAAAS
jgi:hypothetical protein